MRFALGCLQRSRVQFGHRRSGAQLPRFAAGLLGCILLAAHAWAQPSFVITTVAGSDFVFRGDGGPATSAQLSQAPHVAADGASNIYVADRDNHQVVRIDSSGVLTVVAGNGIEGYSGDGAPAVRASLSFPSAVAIDGHGNLFIADAGNYRIRRVSTAGQISTIAGTGEKGFAGDGGPAVRARLDNPIGIAVDSAGNVFFSDSGVHRVRRVGLDGNVSTVAGTGQPGFGGDGGPATAASLREPWHLAFDSAGNLLIADWRNHRVRRVTPAGIVSTIAGTGQARTAGDGGPASAASLLGPSGVFADTASGAVYISGFDHRVRRIAPDGIIQTIAGGAGTGFSGDGGPAAQALLNVPVGVAGDNRGNLFLADSLNLRVRRIDPQGTISTFGGNGQFRYSGDGGQAVAASIGFPYGLAVDPSGNIYISDTNNHRVRRVGKDGIITTFAGTGAAGFSGDGGRAAQAALNTPLGLAADEQGNIYIADSLNRRVRRVTRGGMINTIAGGGDAAGLPVDGMQATAASISPASISHDLVGSLYIFDPARCVIFRLTADGRLFRHAGRLLECGYSGDGGPARLASIHPGGGAGGGIHADSAGNLFLAEPNGRRVRRVAPDGTITTFAGNGEFALPTEGVPATSSAMPSPLTVFRAPELLLISDISGVYGVVSGVLFRLAGNLLSDEMGDGGPASEAASFPAPAIATDSQGNFLLVDLLHSRVRSVLLSPPGISLSQSSVSLKAASGGARTLPKTVTVTASIPGVGFSASVNESSRSWLHLNPGAGTAPRQLEIFADPANLAPGIYSGTISLTAPLAQPAAHQIRVRIEVGPGQPPVLELDKPNFSFAFPAAAQPRTQSVLVRNAGGGVLDFAVEAITDTGGAWLTLSAASGRATPGSPVTIAVTATPGGLAAGTYRGSIVVSAAGQTETLPVTMTISENDRAILLSQTGLSFTAVSRGGVVPTASFQVLNIGRGSVDYTVSTSTLAGGSGWLSAGPRTGRSDASSPEPPTVTVRVNQAGLSPGSYFGAVQIDALGAANSPQVLTVFLEVLPNGADPGPLVEPAELVFTAVAGGPSPASQEAFVYNVAAAPNTFRSTATLGAGMDANVSLVNRPTDLTLEVARANRLVVQPFIGNLEAGVHRGRVNLQFSDGRVRSLGVVVILTPGGDTKEIVAQSGCAPQHLVPAITSLAQSIPVTVGWPVSITAEVRDDCGNAIDQGSVVVSFSNGDPSIALVSVRNGRWSGTWPSRSSAAAEILVKVEAVEPNLQIKGEQTLLLGVAARQEPPYLESRGVVSAAAFQPFVPLAPGAIISIFGERLAGVNGQAQSLPLPQQIENTRVLIGGRQSPLLYVSPGQINAIVPAGIEPNTTHQVLVQRGFTLARPVPIDVARAQPAIFLAGPDGQGHVYRLRPDGSFVLASPGNPAMPGDYLVLYASGLGAVSAPVEDGAAAPVSPLAMVTEQLSVTIGGVDAAIDFAGLTPGFAGLYQLNIRMPEGVSPGDAVPVVIRAAQQVSPAATIAAR